MGLLGESTGTGGAVAIDTSPSTEETAETEEEVDRSVTGGLEGGSVWVVESLVTFWIGFRRRKRTRMIVSLWLDRMEPKQPTF